MSNNRTEQQALISGLAPTVDLSELQAAIITDGYVFKKDVASSASVGTSTTVDFSAVDQKVITIVTDCVISFTGLEDGQRAKLVIDKGNTNIVSFAGGAEYTLGRQYGIKYLFFDVVKIGTSIFVTQISGNSNGSLIISNITYPAGVSAPVFNYGQYVINGLIAKVEVSIEYYQGTNLPTIPLAVNVANVLGRFATSGSIAGVAKVTVGGNNLPCDALITDNGSTYDILIDRADTPSFGTGTFVVTFSFSVILK